MEKEKLKRKINAFDIFVIFLVLCLIGTLVFRLYKGAARERNNGNAEFVVQFDCDLAYDSVASYVKAGDRVYLSSSGSLLGFIINDGDSTGNVLYENNTYKEDVSTCEMTESHGEETTVSEENTNLLISDNAENNELTTMDMSYNIVSLSGKMRLNGNFQRSNVGSYYVLDNENITVGSKLKVYTDRVEFTITIVEISEIEK